MIITRSMLAVLIAIASLGCGGSSTSSGPSATGGLALRIPLMLTGPAAPSADAVLDQVVAAGTTVLLDGRGSVDPDGDEIIYFWEQTTGREVELMAEEDGTATFVAPDSGRYEFSLVVSDSGTSSSPDEVRIIAVLQNVPPIADAGLDQTVVFGDTVQLDGSGSEDPFLGEIVSYRWEAPEGIALQQAD